MEKIVVRIANSSDIESICGLYDEFYKYNNMQQSFSCAEVKENGIYPKYVIEGITGDIFISELDEKIVGFIHAEECNTPPYPSIVQRKFAFIIDFFVIPEHRKKGIGKLLLEKVKEWAINRKLEYLELIVLNENETGKNFYKKECFKITSHTMRYVL